ncbi:MAG: STAS domain-containing protein [Chromatiales bacterium]|nr:STAS domain-containing protein [Chromatiales bacterium]
MSSKKDNVDIGFDPLAWMNDGDSNDAAEAVAKPSTQASAPEATAAEVPPVEAVAAPAEDIVQTTASQQTTSSGGDYRIDLAGKIDIASATELKQELSEALNQSGAIIFDAADVSRADGAGLQLLTSFIRELDGINREVVWEKPSEQLLDAANIVGLTEVLHLS